MKISLFLVVFLFPILVYAHGTEDFSAAESIIEQKIPCEDLSYEELELIGDYYMELMHPGEAHEQMDLMMGGEGSESLRAAHINMAESFYCGEHELVSGGMMNNMMGRGSYNDYNNPMNAPYYSNHMNPYYFSWTNILLGALIVALAVILTLVLNNKKVKK